MQALLYANLTSLTLTETLAGGSFTWPRLVAGCDITLRLRPTIRVEGAPESADNRNIHAIKASIGKADARPEAGTFQLKIGVGAESAGVNVTAAIPCNATADQLQTAINALSSLSATPATVTLRDGTYMIRFSDGLQKAITCVDNGLWPMTFVNVNVHTFDEVYVHDLRLTQAIVAETTLFTLRTSAQPAVTRIQSGATNSDIKTAEIQKLYIPAEFNSGSFILQRGYKKTAPIGLPTSAAEIEAALTAIADDDGTFGVTEQQDAVLISFNGSMAGTAQDLIEVEILEGPSPHAELTLSTLTAAMDALMRRLDTAGEVKVPLELTITMEDAWDDEVTHDYAIRTQLTFLPAVNTAARNVAADLDWNQPLAVRSYKAWSPTQVVVGQRAYVEAIGDGAAASFTLNHNLDRECLHVTVRENVEGGALIHPDDYTVSFDNNNSLTLTPVGTLDADEWVVSISTADQPASFLAHEHVQSEITGLEARLEAIEAAIAALQTHAPTGGFSTSTSAEEILMSWPLEKKLELYPRTKTSDVPAAGADLVSLFQLPSSLLTRDGGLVPAVHDAAAEELVVPLEYDDANKGKVFQNQTGETVRLPGSRGRKGVDLLDDEYCAYDGRVWYRVAKEDAAKNSWYPTDFNRELFSFIVTDKMFPVGHTLKVDLGLELMMALSKSANWQQISSNLKRTSAQWKLVLEKGALTSDSSPATTDANLAAITWDTATPMLSQILSITHTPMVHYAGVHIARATGGITAKQFVYASSAAAGSAPSAFPFALRARLCAFDTENGVSDPRGILALYGLDRDPKGEAGASSERGRAVIVKS